MKIFGEHFLVSKDTKQLDNHISYRNASTYSTGTVASKLSP